MKIDGKTVVVTILILVAITSVTAPFMSMQITCSKLHVDGKFIKDELGNVVVLKGVNDNSMVDYPSSGRWMGSTAWSEANVKLHLDTMKSWGANCLRQIQPVKGWTQNYNTGMPYISAVKRVIELCNERGIYYVFSPWTVGQGYGDGTTQDPLPYPPYQTTPGAESVIPNEQTFINYWADVANQLKGYPNVLFDLWNEPCSKTSGDGAFDSWIGNGASSVVQRLITAIRSTGAANLIVIEGKMGCWVNLSYPPPNPSDTLDWVLTAMTNIQDPLNNRVYSTHLYRSYGAFHYTVPTRTNAYNMTEIQKAFQHFRFSEVVSKAPLYIGEFGASLSASDYDHELEAFDNMMTIFDQEGIHYTAFWWREIGTFRLIQSDFKTPTASGTIVQNHLKGTPPTTYYKYPHFSSSANTTLGQLKNQKKPYVLTETRTANHSVTVTSITIDNNTLIITIDGTGIQTIKVFCAGYGQPQATGGTAKSYDSTTDILQIEIVFHSIATVELAWATSLDTPPSTSGISPPSEPVQGDYSTSDISIPPAIQAPLNISLIFAFLIVGVLLYRRKGKHR